MQNVREGDSGGQSHKSSTPSPNREKCIDMYNRGVETHDDEDVALARALIEGRLEAFDAFVEHFRTRVFQYSYLMCGHREDAEEVAQDTLMKVFENFASLREPEKVRSWVFRIAKNACLMKRRRSIFAPPHELSLDDSVHEPSSGEMPDVGVYRHEIQSALTAAIQQLPPNYRSVVLLRDIEELSTEEAAEILEVSPDVVKQRLHRGRLALRKLLGKVHA
jgi:RNA polymerase sigma-70 factor, ECF subfamily